MNRILARIVLAAGTAGCCFAANAGPRTVSCFNSGWEWRPGGAKEWRAVDLPHDFMFEGQWSGSANHSQRVFKPLGEAFYRKTFDYDRVWDGKRVILDFGGIMFFGDVKINGEKVAQTEYGYLGFETDITDWLKKDAPNTVEVWAKVSGGRNGCRWYTGGGLCRGVKMKVAGEKRIARHGIYVTAKGDTVSVEVELNGFCGWRGECEIIAETEGFRVSAPVPEGDNRRRFSVSLPDFTMKGAARWSPGSPNLHTLRVSLAGKDGEVFDSDSVRFGLRDIRFSPERGLEIDGKKVFLKGQSNHDDSGALGAAAYPDAIRRYFRTIKKFGFNSVRCSHNPYSPEFYDIADEEGIVVVDEICDKWVRNWAGRKPYLEIWPGLVTEWVKRDRNHPSVVLWSLGNELQMNENYHDAQFEDWGVTTYRMMDVVVKRWDKTRPTTVAMFPSRANGIGKHDSRFQDKSYWIAPELAQTTEVSSFNYQWIAFGEYLKHSPGMIVYQSEATTSEWLDPYFGMDRGRSVGCSYWGATEYWGESNAWPKKGWNWSYFSHSMKPRPQAWLIKSGFDRSTPVVHIGVVEATETQEWNEVKSGQQVLRENWNRKPGEKTGVWVFSNAPEVELFLNGKSLGKKQVVRPPEGDAAWRCAKDEKIHAVQYCVEWESGELRAVGSNGSEYSIRTTGPVAGLKFDVERYPELSFVWIKAVDKDGLEVPDATMDVMVSVEGPGRLLALDDGDHSTELPFNVDRKRMCEGWLLAIVRRTGEGRISLFANGEECPLSGTDAPATWPLQAKIDEIAASGGGVLTLGPGVYRTGALFFKPGVNLHLEKGAVIQGVDEAEGYPMRETRIEGETCLYYPALVNADGCDGFTISGEGVIDGHGANTWEEFWTKRAEARARGGDLRNKDLMRPRVLYVSRSKNVDISGVEFKNSKFWTTHFYDCDDVVVHDCKITAEILKDSKGGELKGPSTDAIDIDKCRRFTVRNVDISVNDDGVVVKGGKGPWADDSSKFPGNGPTVDVLVENCIFRHPTHSALTLGSESPAATNVTMRSCTMAGCGNMINLKMRTDTPQHYSNVLVENCRGKCHAFFHVQSWSQYHDAKGRPKDELMSYADGVTLRGNSIEAPRAKSIDWRNDIFKISNLKFENNTVNGRPIE